MPFRYQVFNVCNKNNFRVRYVKVTINSLFKKHTLKIILKKMNIDNFSQSFAFCFLTIKQKSKLFRSPLNSYRIITVQLHQLIFGV